jgi:hypothetical protein
MKINKNKIQYYRENPSAFVEDIYNIKLLPYQKYYLNKISKQDKIYIPLSYLYSNNLILTTLTTLMQKDLKERLQ